MINDPNRVPLKGVIEPNPFPVLIGFHATTSSLRDLMHNFIEGICPVIIISFLKQASALRIITYINTEIETTVPFLEDREKLLRGVENDSISYDGSLSNTSTIPKAPNFTMQNAQTSPAVLVSSQSLSSIYLSNINLSSTMSMNNLTADQFITASDIPSSNGKPRSPVLLLDYNGVH
ncbi:unnamed protein product [Rotaria magnacalcarata]|uniref:Uncharacterized protein n=1 Tax=Rotaria magnacalcarata TaxID=392030 RepID=A0A816MQS6_9BILA|nr:unnamed protein product [Rotaria magnacalcarata]